MTIRSRVAAALLVGGLLVGGVLAGGVMAGPALAGPMPGPAAAPAAPGLVETVASYKYHRSCTWANGAWGYKNRHGKIVVCRPRKPFGRYWIWHSESGRHGWYNRQKKSWHYQKW